MYWLIMSEEKINLSKCPYTTRSVRQERQSITSEGHILSISTSSSGMTTPQIISYNTPDWVSAHLLLDCSSSVQFSTLGSMSVTDMNILQMGLLHWLQSISSIQPSSFSAISCSHRSFHALSWQSCFLDMFETALLDAENMLISLPYDRIRWHLQKYSVCLDAVVTPRLTTLNALDLENVLVNTTSMQVTGLLDYSIALWSDPELAYYCARFDLSGFDLTPVLRVDRDGIHQRDLL